MPPPSSGGRRSQRSAAIWTYAADRTGQVLWYCPPGGSEDKRCRNRVAIQDYWRKQYGSTTGIPYDQFTFKNKDVPPYWKSVGADTSRDDESDEGQQESNGSSSDGGRGGGRSDNASHLAAGPGENMASSSSPANGTVRNGGLTFIILLFISNPVVQHKQTSVPCYIERYPTKVRVKVPTGLAKL